MKLSVEELKKRFILEEGVLIWNMPSRARVVKGSMAGTVSRRGSVIVEIKDKPYQAAHIVWAMCKGEYSKYRIEHLNGDKQDNHIENLRELKPNSLEVNQELVKRIFEYKNGYLYWKERPTTQSRMKIGEIAGFIMKNNTKHEYRYVSIGGRRYKHANLVWLYHNGEIPKMLDHINHNPQDDRIEKLRVATTKENCKNQVIRKNNTSGTTGVNWNKSIKRWVARISDDDGDRVTLGYFKKLENAIRARKEAEKEFNYHANHGRT